MPPVRGCRPLRELGVADAGNELWWKDRRYDKIYERLLKSSEKDQLMLNPIKGHRVIICDEPEPYYAHVHEGLSLNDQIKDERI